MQLILKYKSSIIWAIIILILSGMSGDAVGKISFIKIPHFDKIVHFAIYFVFCSIIIYETGFLKTKYTFTALFIISLISVSYGILMEFMQEYVFIKRSNDIFDVIANLTGTVFSIFALIIYRNRILDNKTKK